MVNVWSVMITNPWNTTHWNTNKRLKLIIQSTLSEPPSISPVRLQRSVNQHWIKLPAMATAGTLEKYSSEKTVWSGMHLKCGRNIEMGISITLISFMAENECQLRAEYSILPVWHTEWAFQRQTWEENVCSCTVQHRPQRAPFHQNAGCSDRGWTMKKWLRWQTKIDLALLCAFSSPHPSLFSVFRAPPGWRKSRKAAAERGRRDGKGRHWGGKGERKRDNGDWEALAAWGGTDGL